MKIIGLSCGRKNGMCETFLEEAATGAAEFGVETEIIRAMSLKVLPCNSCWGCGPTGKCVLKDDVEWILDKTCVEDAALIMGVPCYHIRANGYFVNIHERMNHIFMRDFNVLKKTKVGAMIGVGGGGYDAWATLTNPMVNIFLQHTRVLVDQIQVNFCGLKEWNAWLREDMKKPVSHEMRVQDLDYDELFRLWPDQETGESFYKKALARARELGGNVAKAMMMPIEDVKYVGEETGASCPSCHSNVLVVPEDLPYVCCPICYVRGVVSFEGGKPRIEWNMSDVKTPRFSYEAVKHHMEWLQKNEPRAGAAREGMIRDRQRTARFIKPKKA